MVSCASLSKSASECPLSDAFGGVGVLHGVAGTHSWPLLLAKDKPGAGSCKDGDVVSISLGSGGLDARDTSG